MLESSENKFVGFFGKAGVDFNYTIILSTNEDSVGVKIFLEKTYRIKKERKLLIK